MTSRRARPRTRPAVTPLEARDVPAAGLAATFFDSPTLADARALSGPAVTQVVPDINFPWGNGGPAGVAADTFAARLEGFVTPQASGDHVFRTQADDGVRVWVDNKLVIDDWKDGGARLRTSGPVALTAGKPAALKVEYYENRGQAVLKLDWQAPAAATFRTLDFAGVADDRDVPDGYGDVAGQVDVRYRAVGADGQAVGDTFDKGTGAINGWSGPGYGSRTGVAYAAAEPGQFGELAFVPAAGRQVGLSTFDLASWEVARPGVAVRVVDDATGQPVWQRTVDLPAGRAVTLTPGLVSTKGLRLQFDALAGQVGVDNVTYLAGPAAAAPPGPAFAAVPAGALSFVPVAAGLTAAGGDGQARLTWAAAPGAVGYVVTRTGGGGTVVVADGQPQTWVEDAGVANGTTYTYTVRAVDAAGTEAVAGPSAAVTPTTAGLSYRLWAVNNTNGTASVGVGALSYNGYRYFNNATVGLDSAWFVRPDGTGYSGIRGPARRAERTGLDGLRVAYRVEDRERAPGVFRDVTVDVTFRQDGGHLRQDIRVTNGHPTDALADAQVRFFWATFPHLPVTADGTAGRPELPEAWSFEPGPFFANNYQAQFGGNTDLLTDRRVPVVQFASRAGTLAIRAEDLGTNQAAGFRFPFGAEPGTSRYHATAAFRDVAAGGRAKAGTFGLKFAPGRQDLTAFNADVVGQYRGLYPYNRYGNILQDRRPIASNFIAGADPKTTNPSGLFEAFEDTTTAAGLDRVLSRHIDSATRFVNRDTTWPDGKPRELGNLAAWGAQGIVFWDIEASRAGHKYVGDPRLVDRIHPEVNTVRQANAGRTYTDYAGRDEQGRPRTRPLAFVDEMFQIYRGAGFRVGHGLRGSTTTVAWRDEPLPGGGTRRVEAVVGHTQFSVYDVQGMIDDLFAKIEYAYERWGSTLFYVDSTVARDGNREAEFPAAVWDGLNKKLADNFTLDAAGKPVPRGAGGVPVGPGTPVQFLVMPENQSGSNYAATAPYEEGGHHGATGTPDYVRAVWPEASSVMRLGFEAVDKGWYTRDDFRGRLVNAVRRGDRLMFEVFNQQTGPFAKGIYDEAARLNADNAPFYAPPVWAGDGRVANGGFESGLAPDATGRAGNPGWSTAGVGAHDPSSLDYTEVTPLAYSGRGVGAHAGDPDRSSYWVDTYQRVNGVAAGTYQLSGRFRSSGGQRVSTFGARLRAADGTVRVVSVDLKAAVRADGLRDPRGAAVAANPTGDAVRGLWTPVTLPVTVRPGEAVEVFVYSDAVRLVESVGPPRVEGQPWLLFDDIQLTPPGQGLVDGGFDLGGANWALSRHQVDVADLPPAAVRADGRAYAGSGYAVHFVPTPVERGAPDVPRPYRLWTWSGVSVAAGVAPGRYTLSARVRQSGGLGDSHLGLQGTGADGRFRQQIAPFRDVPAAGADDKALRDLGPDPTPDQVRGLWTRVAAEVDIRAGDTGLQVYVYTDGQTGQWLWFDDVRLEPVGGGANVLGTGGGFDGPAAGRLPEPWGTGWSGPKYDGPAALWADPLAYSGAAYAMHYLPETVVTAAGSAGPAPWVEGYKVESSQRVAGAAAGRYTLSGQFRTSGGQAVATFGLRRTAADGTVTVQAVDLSGRTPGVLAAVPAGDPDAVALLQRTANNPPRADVQALWTKVELDVTVAAGETVEVFVYSDAAAGQWLMFDDLALTPRAV